MKTSSKRLASLGSLLATALGVATALAACGTPSPVTVNSP